MTSKIISKHRNEIFTEILNFDKVLILLNNDRSKLNMLEFHDKYKHIINKLTIRKV